MSLQQVINDFSADWAKVQLNSITHSVYDFTCNLRLVFYRYVVATLRMAERSFMKRCVFRPATELILPL